MFTQINTIIIYGTYLFAPGYLILSSAGVNKHRFLLSIGLSLSIIVLTLAPVYRIGGNIELWLIILHLIIAAFVLGVKLLPTLHRGSKAEKAHLHRLKSQRTYGFGFILVLVSFGLYHAIVGPFTD